MKPQKTVIHIRSKVVDFFAVLVGNDGSFCGASICAEDDAILNVVPCYS